MAAFLITVVTLAACGGAYNPTAGRSPARVATSNTTSSGYQVLYRFEGEPDGASPLDGLVAFHGKLYGTTLNGSKNYCSQSCGRNGCYLGCGTVFSVDASGRERIVYSFRGNLKYAHDGAHPFAPLTLLNDSLYGTTSGDGTDNEGTVYTVTTGGTERVLYYFQGSDDGAVPEAGMTAIKGELYGTTVYGGTFNGHGCGGSGCGTVFSVTPAGTERVIYAFEGGTDGDRLYSGVVELQGELYGTTLHGGSGCGSNGCGTVYELSIGTAGIKQTLHTFAGGNDGAYPNGLIAVKNVLYGTTENGGAKGSGTFYSITPSGAEKVLYTFQDIPDGVGPAANLIYNNGYFYGTTAGGGSFGDGTVFKVTPSGTEAILYSFRGGDDGSAPEGPVRLYNGELYGTTSSGGGNGCGGAGCGTIFELRP